MQTLDGFSVYKNIFFRHHLFAFCLKFVVICWFSKQPLKQHFEILSTDFQKINKDMISQGCKHCKD